MKGQVKYNFSYELTDEQIKRYKEMPIDKRLEWLYLGNLIRKAFSEKIVNVWDKFPERKIYICRGDKDVMQAAKIHGVELRLRVKRGNGP